MITFFSVSKSSSRRLGRRMSERTSNACGQVLGEAGDVVERVLLGGLGVVLGTDAVEVAVDRQGVALRRPLEDHVLEEVRHARDLGRLVAAPRLDEEPRGDRPRLVVQLGDDLEAVIEDRVVEVHQGTPIAVR